MLLYWKLLFKHNFTPHIKKTDISSLVESLCISRNGNTKGFGRLLISWMIRDICYCIVSFVRNNFDRMIRAIPIALRLMIEDDISFSVVSPVLRQL